MTDAETVTFLALRSAVYLVPFELREVDSAAQRSVELIGSFYP